MDYAKLFTQKKMLSIQSLDFFQISSEVYLFSHIKGKKHQQAVRENSSIQGRELSDEEVVGFWVCFFLKKKHSPSLKYVV